MINADGADVEIRDLTIGSSARPGLWVVGDGVSASVRSLVVDGAELAGVSVESGAHLDA
ncbi:MAG: hypothetical protein GWN73_12625, partial [Actinobacteria bacterium]|nr:hypothetical protein [Actinomycetota bacterium]NIU66211.1 hypothetical protein [Actinomycetota bacterium]